MVEIVVVVPPFCVDVATPIARPGPVGPAEAEVETDGATGFLCAAGFPNVRSATTPPPARSAHASAIDTARLIR